MATLELEPSEAQVEELERLWAAPVARRAPRRRRRALRRLPDVVALGWAIFVLGVFAFEPAPNPAAVTPMWANVTLAAFWLALPAAALLAFLGLGRVALGASAFAGGIGIALGYDFGAMGIQLSAW